MILRFLVFLIGVALAAPCIFGVNSEPHMKTKVCGTDEQYCADVDLYAGKNRMAVDAVVTVEQVFGQDPQGTTWFYFGNTLYDADGIGSAGNTVRVQIPAAVTPLGTIYPAVDKTYTITSGDVASSNPERTVAINVCAGLTGDTNFQTAKWKCDVAKDFALVHISSKLFNEFGTRTSWTVTCSGSTVCNKGYDDIERRGKPTELSRSPNDPRQGVLAIAGSVTTQPGAIGSRYQEYFKNTGASTLRVNGSVTPVVFTIPTSSTRDIYIEQVRCFGGGNKIKFEQFLSKNTCLTNGILIEVKSDNETSSWEAIKCTEDFKNLFASNASANFRIDIQAGGDQFIAIYNPTIPFPLRVQGAFGTGNDDYMKVTVRDNLTSVGSQLECQAWGFTKEP